MNIHEYQAKQLLAKNGGGGAGRGRLFLAGGSPLDRRQALRRGLQAGHHQNHKSTLAGAGQGLSRTV